MKPSLIVFGNCQAEIIKGYFDRFPSLCDAYDIVYARSYNHPVEGAAPPLSADLLERCAILLEQKGIREEFGQSAMLPETCLIRRFPTLGLKLLWPLECYDDRNRPEEGFPFGRFPYGDRVALQLAREGWTGEAGLRRYREASRPELGDLNRLLQEETERLTGTDALCDISMGDYILKNFRQKRLFWTSNHPTLDLLVDAFDALMRTMPLSEPTLEGYDRVLDDLRAESHFQDYHQPIHPTVAEHFGLEWCSSEMSYNYHNRAQWNFEEFMIRYLKYEEDEDDFSSYEVQRAF